MTVDRLMAEFRLEKIDILKMDIEGAEKEVFEDTSAGYQRKAGQKACRMGKAQRTRRSQP